MTRFLFFEILNVSKCRYKNDYLRNETLCLSIHSYLIILIDWLMCLFVGAKAFTRSCRIFKMCLQLKVYRWPLSSEFGGDLSFLWPTFFQIFCGVLTNRHDIFSTRTKVVLRLVHLVFKVIAAARSWEQFHPRSTCEVSYALYIS